MTVKLGETYMYSSPMGASVVFVVVNEIDNYRMSDRDLVDKPGFEALILLTSDIKFGNGSVREGLIMPMARNSPLAVDSVRFPAEE